MDKTYAHIQQFPLTNIGAILYRVVQRIVGAKAHYLFAHAQCSGNLNPRLNFVLNTIQLDPTTLTLGPSFNYVGQINLKLECKIWTMVSGPNLVTSLE